MMRSVVIVWTRRGSCYRRYVIYLCPWMTYFHFPFRFENFHRESGVDSCETSQIKSRNVLWFVTVESRTENDESFWDQRLSRINCQSVPSVSVSLVRFDFWTDALLRRRRRMDNEEITKRGFENVNMDYDTVRTWLRIYKIIRFSLSDSVMILCKRRVKRMSFRWWSRFKRLSTTFFFPWFFEISKGYQLSFSRHSVRNFESQSLSYFIRIQESEDSVKS